jgi:hypothetical protein
MKILVAWLMIMTACQTGTAAAQSAAFCLRGCDFGAGDCSFATYEQCRATASGRTAWCEANPYFRSVSDVQRGSQARVSRRRL